MVLRKTIPGHFQFHYVALQAPMAEPEHLVLQDLMAKQLQILQQFQELPVQQEQLVLRDPQVLPVHLVALVQRDLLDQQAVPVQQELMVRRDRSA
jgi:hypothetical protein